MPQTPEPVDIASLFLNWPARLAQRCGYTHDAGGQARGTVRLAARCSSRPPSRGRAATPPDSHTIKVFAPDPGGSVLTRDPRNIAAPMVAVAQLLPATCRACRARTAPMCARCCGVQMRRRRAAAGASPQGES